MNIDEQIEFLEVFSAKVYNRGFLKRYLDAILATLKQVKQAQANKGDDFEFTTNDLDNPESI